MAFPQHSEVAAIWYGVLVDHSSTVATGGTSQTALPANPSRKYLFIQNPASQTESLFVNFTSAASTSDGKSFELVPGAVLQFDTSGFITRELMTVTAATNGHPYTCKEA